MKETFFLTLNQMIVLFIFIIIGYIMKKAKTVSPSSGDAISKLLLYVFMPATCFDTFAAHCTPAVVTSRLPLILAGFGVLFAALAVACLLARLMSKNIRTREVYIFGFVVSNLGYLGYPLVNAVFGSDILFDFMVFCMPFNLFIYSFGMYLLNPQKKLTVRIFSSPTILAIFAGIAVGLSGLHLPSPVTSAVTAASACMAPCAMILTGMVLAEIPIRETFCSPVLYLASFIRLIGLPAFFGAALWFLFRNREITLIAVTMLCLPMGLNNVVFTKAYGGDSETGAKTCFLTNVLGMVTIPIVYAVAFWIFS